jgi:alpha/beta superfamily hydrolase
MNLTELQLNVGDNSLLIPGPQGQIETSITVPDGKVLGIAIVCHPHSLMSGSMHNKVVHTLARTYRDLSLIAVRFNFRGVGASAGEFAHGIGETEDLYAVANWIRQKLPNKPLFLAGFSFGSFVAYRACNQLQCRHLILIGPPVPRFDYNSVPLPQCPWLVVQGEKDEVVEPEAVFAWIENLAIPPQVLRFAQATHFFHGQLVALKEQLTAHLQAYLSTAAA